MLTAFTALLHGVTNSYSTAMFSELTLASQEETDPFIILPLRLINPFNADGGERQEVLPFNIS